jgi:c-di-AMP phosphodiesterase-like protein
MDEEQKSMVVIIALIAVLASFMYWAWLTSLELFTIGIMALAVGLYFAFITALSQEAKKYFMQEMHQQEKKQLERQLCTSPN